MIRPGVMRSVLVGISPVTGSAKLASSARRKKLRSGRLPQAIGVTPTMVRTVSAQK